MRACSVLRWGLITEVSAEEMYSAEIDSAINKTEM